MADSAVGGLAGVTVVVTRPLEGAGALASLFEQAGADTIVMPLIQLADVATEAEIAAAVGPLGDNDWVVASSVYAADRVAKAVSDRPVRVAAVGATTAAVLPRVDLVPARQSADGLLEVFPACDPPGSATVLVAQSADGATTLVDGLAALGWRARRLNTHRPRAVVPSAAQQLAVLRAGVVVFTSGTQVLAWREVFGDSTPPVVASIGPQTTQVAENAGMKVQITATDHSLPGVVRAVERFLTAGSN
jgi:uroporphyrinogen III methyltransferase/synthase